MKTYLQLTKAHINRFFTEGRHGDDVGRRSAFFTLSVPTGSTLKSFEILDDSRKSFLFLLKFLLIVMGVLYFQSYASGQCILVMTPDTTICQGESVTISVVNIGPPGNYNYSWSTGSSSEEIIESPDNTITYYVTVTNVDDNNDICMDSVTVTVNMNPTVIVGSNTPVCVGDDIQLTSTPSGGTGPYDYAWSGPDSFSPMVQNPTRTNAELAHTGTYRVTITDSNDCKGTGEDGVQVNPSVTPSITIKASNNPICAGGSVIFSIDAVMNEGQSPEYQWKRNNVVDGIGITYNLTSPTNGDVITLELKSSATCANPSMVTSNAIIMNVNPIPNIDPISDISVCSGESIVIPIFMGGVPGTMFTWKHTNAAIGLALLEGFGNVPLFTGTNTTSPISSTFTVTPSFTSGGVTCFGTSETFTITVNPNPVVNITVNSDIFCTGATLNLDATGTSGGGFSYNWSGPVTIQPVKNPSLNNVSISHSGEYFVTVTNTNTSCTNTDSKVIVVFAQPTLSISAPMIVVPNTAITMNVSIAPGGLSSSVLNYEWYRGPAMTLIPGAINNSLNVNNLTSTETFKACATFPIATGCNKVCSDITISVIQIPDFTIQGNSNPCLGQTVIYYAPTIYFPSDTFVWDIQPPITTTSLAPNGSIIAVTWTMPGMYEIKATHNVFGGISKESPEFKVTVSNANTITTSEVNIYHYTFNNIFIAKDSLADCYQWGYIDANTGNIFEIPGATYQAYAPGTDYRPERNYWVKTWMGDCNNPVCPNTSYKVIEREGFVTGGNGKPSLLLYPNPTDGVVHIRGQNMYPGEYKATLVSTVGHQLKAFVLSSNGLIFSEVDLSLYPTGIYYLNIIDPFGYSISHKIVRF